MKTIRTIFLITLPILFFSVSLVYATEINSTDFQSENRSSTVEKLIPLMFTINDYKMLKLDKKRYRQTKGIINGYIDFQRIQNINLYDKKQIETKIKNDINTIFKTSQTPQEMLSYFYNLENKYSSITGMLKGAYGSEKRLDYYRMNNKEEFKKALEFADGSFKYYHLLAKVAKGQFPKK